MRGCGGIRRLEYWSGFHLPCKVVITSWLLPITEGRREGRVVSRSYENPSNLSKFFSWGGKNGREDI